MSISFVVPVYKIKEEYLRKCLDSILSQTDGNWEAILVDDGSPDNSGQICDEYAAKDSRFSVYHQENQGVSVARNIGIDHAKYGWVTFVDPDDWIDEKTVELLNCQLIRNDSDILAFGYAREFIDRSKPEYLMHENKRIPGHLLKRMRLAPLYRLVRDGRVYPYTVNAIWNKVYKVSFLDKFGIRFEASARKGQDRVFNLYALDKTDNVYYLDKLLYHYRNDNEDSIVNRYNPNTVKNSQVVLKLMLDWIVENEKPQEYLDMLYCWTCTRVQEYMRLYFFHKQRKMPYHRVKEELNVLLRSEPYGTAFSKAKKSLFTWEERFFIFFVNIKQYWICKELIRAREFIRRRGKK